MNWMMWGGLAIWLVVSAIVLWAVFEVIRFRRSRRREQQQRISGGLDGQ